MVKRESWRVEGVGRGRLEMCDSGAWYAALCSCGDGLCGGDGWTVVAGEWSSGTGGRGGWRARGPGCGAWHTSLSAGGPAVGGCGQGGVAGGGGQAFGGGGGVEGEAH